VLAASLSRVRLCGPSEGFPAGLSSFHRQNYEKKRLENKLYSKFSGRDGLSLAADWLNVMLRLISGVFSKMASFSII
jgi:hypothetical protein